MAATTRTTITLGSRKSELAMWQTLHVKELLEVRPALCGQVAYRSPVDSTHGFSILISCVPFGSLAVQARFPEITVEIKTSVTEGDLKLKQSLAELAAVSPGLFTKELEVWLQAGVCDAAVHSLKDVPTQLPPGLAIAAISEVRTWQYAVH
jgi:porphobilinogen deaminase